jgi:hypothetical protein
MRHDSLQKAGPEPHSAHCDRFREFHPNLRNLTDDEIRFLVYE